MADPRGALREGADVEAIIGVLRDAMVAEKTVWGSCDGCKKKFPVVVRDTAAALRAVELWIEQGFGRQKVSEVEPGGLAAAATLGELEGLSDEELSRIAGG